MSLLNSLSQISAYEQKKLDVWAKGSPIFQNGLHYDAAVWRRDANGSVIKFSEYGNRDSQYGWEMDHFPIPKALGGSDDVANLRPLHYVANAAHGGILGAALR